MLKYLEKTVACIKQGKNVYLAPACCETVLIAKMLDGMFGVRVSGFCDNDTRKHDKQLNSLPQYKIYSFDDALKDETAVFLVVSVFHSATIIADLTVGKGVQPDKIINYQEIELKQTCARFAQNWIIEDKSFLCCCIEEYKPRFDYKGLDVKAGVAYLQKTRNDLIDGIAPLPDGCKNCFNYKPSYIYKSRRLNSLNFSFRGWCNYKCDYCSAHHPDLKEYNNKFLLEEYLVELERNGMTNEIFSVLNAVGEPTLNEKRFSLYDYCREKMYFLDMFSNCSVFDKTLFELAHESPVIIRKSIDAGTKETYAKIKGVDCFEKMLDNVRKYLTAPYLVLNPKYLFVPGINDNETDIEEFVKICVELKVDFVTPVFSILSDTYFNSNHAKKMFAYLVKLLDDNNIMTARVDTLYSERYNQTYTASFREEK